MNLLTKFVITAIAIFTLEAAVIALLNEIKTRKNKNEQKDKKK